MTYFIASAGWNASSPNPFSDDGSYTGWSCFEVVPELDWNFVHGKADSGLFHMRFSPACPTMEARLADFLRYEEQHGRKTIVALPCDVDARGFVDRALSENPPGTYAGANQITWMVHSTDLDAWREITKCGELLSLAKLKQKGVNPLALGYADLREPDDYADYVMLGSWDMIGPEHVVASRAKGGIVTEETRAYTPGVRMYFDGRRIIDDGLAVWDGIHQLKVFGSLPLAAYLITAITAQDLDPKLQVTEWTPRTFLDAATQLFEKTVGARPCSSPNSAAKPPSSI